MGNLLDKLFRDKLSNRVFEADPSDWEAMEALIAANSAQSAAAPKTQTKRKALILFLLLLMITSIGIFQLNRSTSEVHDSASHAEILTESKQSNADMTSAQHMVESTESLSSNEHSDHIKLETFVSPIEKQSEKSIETKTFELGKEELSASNIQEMIPVLNSDVDPALINELTVQEKSEFPIGNIETSINYLKLFNLNRSNQELLNWNKAVLNIPMPAMDIVVKPSRAMQGLYMSYNSFGDFNSMELGLFKSFRLSEKTGLLIESGYSFSKANRTSIAEQKSDYLSYTAVEYEQELLARQLHSFRLSLLGEYAIKENRFSLGIVYDQIFAINAERKLKLDGVLDRSDHIWLERSYYNSHKYRARIAFTRFIQKHLAFSLNYELPLNATARFNTSNSIGISLKYSI